MKNQFYGIAVATALIFGGAVGSAKADTVYNLTQDNCTGGCNPSPGSSMGTVTLHQNGANDVTVTVDLVSPLEFVNTGLVNTIDFNLGAILSGVTAANFSNSVFSLASGTAGSDHFDGFGNFQYSIEMSGAQGAGGAQPSPLSFDIIASGLTESSFTGNAGNWVFGVDVYNSAKTGTGAGNTGPIGASISSVPEPSEFGFLVGAVALLGLMQWRKCKQQA